VNLYMDASVILRRLLGQAGSMPVDESWATVLTSSLTEVECLRTLDRARVDGRVDEERIAGLREEVFKQLTGMAVVEVTPAVLRRASHPMPTALGTLDAIHIATAFLWIDRGEGEVTLATHDQALARAARASGMAVIGT
jgi:predicted nucleic acid-binding protein